MEELRILIENVGFPIAVTMFLLLRFDKRFIELTNSVDKLTKTIENKFYEKTTN